jgi:hypothetical protein
MDIKYFSAAIILLLFTGSSAMAQGLLKGTVYDNANRNKLPNVFIRDKNTKQLTLSEKDGGFSIRTEPGHTLIFDCPGYVSDTLYVVDMENKKIMMETKTIALREVNINATRQFFDPHTEYPEIYTKSKVYVMSPTTWFSKEGKDARRLKRYFAREEEERRVDAVFNRAYVGSIVPLKGQELDDFMTLYRPSFAFIKSNNSESLAVYINDNYKKFKALPPEKRKLPNLVSQ